MPVYTIVAGVNGVGKSSLTGVLTSERHDLGCIIDVDKIAVEHECSALEAGRIAVTRMDGLLSKGFSFTQETTLSGYRTERTIKTAKSKGYAVRLFYIGLGSQDECIKRVKNRVEKGGHSIDSDVLERRFRTRFDDVLKILPYCDEVFLYDNENGFVQVGTYRNGDVIFIGDYRPPWICALRDYNRTRP